MEPVEARSDSRSRLINASAHEVFAAMSDRDRVARWWGPEGFTNTIHEFEFRPHGKWLLTMHGPDGKDYPNESRFVRVVPDRVFEIEHLSGHHFVLTIDLTEQGGDTLVGWRQTFDTAEHYRQIAAFVAGANEQNLAGGRSVAGEEHRIPLRCNNTKKEITMHKLFAFALLASQVVTAAAQNAPASCDRACLESHVDRYLAAMVAHDAAKAPFAANVKITENAKLVPIGNPQEGLWAVATTLGDYKFYIADPHSGQAAYVGLVDEGGKPALLSMRIRVENERITEVESVVVRSLRPENLWTMKTPPAAFSQALAPEDRVSRAELVRISQIYFESIVRIDSKLVPWHEECYRFENGMWSAGPILPPELAAHVPAPTPSTAQEAPGPSGRSGAFSRGPCPAAIDSGVFAVIESIEPRRTPVVDEERGATWGVYMFNHAGVETVRMPDGSTQKAAYFAGQPNSMPMSELFKIEGGKIRDIMAIGVVNPYKSGSGCSCTAADVVHGGAAGRTPVAASLAPAAR
jgi:uncharacterized protein YndB with AHSA1/START domain